MSEYSDIVAVLLGAMLLTSCSRQDNGAASGIDLSPFQSQRDLVCGAFDPASIERCDRSTFHILMTSSCGQPLPTQYEVPDGKWNRDIEPCYPKDSSSETSRDAYLSLVLSQDKAAISRAIAWAEENGGDTGLPAGGVGNVSDLMPLMRRSVHTDVRETEEEIQAAFSGHRGHLIAGWLWARSRLYDGLTVGGAALLNKLHSETPESPYLSCLYHRFSRLDKDQSGTVKLLKRIPHEDNTFGWGSSPWQVHYVLTVACLSGV